MKLAVLRLVLCAVLFVLWIGFLGFLVLTRPLTPEGRPLVLSRPQIQSAPLIIIADLPAPNDDEAVDVSVTVVEVLQGEGVKPGDIIQVAHLRDCRPVQRSEHRPPADWAGAGEYLLPLVPAPPQPSRFKVAPIPPSPGFSAHITRIYPSTKESKAQYDRIQPR